MLADFHLTLHALDKLLAKGASHENAIEWIFNHSNRNDLDNGVCFTVQNHSDFEQWYRENQSNSLPPSTKRLLKRIERRVTIVRPSVERSIDKASEKDAEKSFLSSHTSLPASQFITGSVVNPANKITNIGSETIKDCDEELAHAQRPEIPTKSDLHKLGAYYERMILCHPFCFRSGSHNHDVFFGDIGLLNVLFGEHPFCQSEELQPIRRLDIFSAYDHNQCNSVEEGVKLLFKTRGFGDRLLNLMLEHKDVDVPIINEVVLHPTGMKRDKYPNPGRFLIVGKHRDAGFSASAAFSLDHRTETPRAWNEAEGGSAVTRLKLNRGTHIATTEFKIDKPETYERLIFRLEDETVNIFKCSKGRLEEEPYEPE